MTDHEATVTGYLVPERTVLMVDGGELVIPPMRHWQVICREHGVYTAVSMAAGDLERLPPVAGEKLLRAQRNMAQRDLRCGATVPNLPLEAEEVPA